ncbi:hypothetical protein FH972_024586 [Carpinus fangiana]|uniref:FAD dependent oxidoreductase domain-containing protein n=1 Tax=Carpinus fangiana TaxID=176857 RepID=A0A5N6KYY4_9ROSI|nr:hypothetical protein FH972_024586 [Carpinus fangiana]
MELKTYIIVGGGVFGVSTALFLIEHYPHCRIILVDKASFPAPSAASADVNKIIRTEYDDLLYLKLALRAQARWKTDKLYAEFFHVAEQVFVDDSGSAQRILEHFKALGVEPAARMMSVSELKERHASYFDQMSFEGERNVYVNPASGWAEASQALARATKKAFDLGVEAVYATVSSLIFDNSGDCCGIRTSDRREFYGSHVVLATGAGTVELLADSAPHRADFRIEGRLLGAAVISAVTRLTPADKERLGRLPITIHDVGQIRGEILPPTADGLLKFASETSFKNTFQHQKSMQMISAPPHRAHQWERQTPLNLQKECTRIRTDIFGKLEDHLKFESYKICWDAVTPDEDFIVSSHPNCTGLYFATGGSFHSWKFLPILGQLVVEMIEGALDHELAARWAWDRRMPDKGNDGLWPEREWKDLRDDEEALIGVPPSPKPTRKKCPSSSDYLFYPITRTYNHSKDSIMSSSVSQAQTVNITAEQPQSWLDQVHADNNNETRAQPWKQWCGESVDTGFGNAEKEDKLQEANARPAACGRSDLSLLVLVLEAETSALRVSVCMNGWLEINSMHANAAATAIVVLPTDEISRRGVALVIVVVVVLKLRPDPESGHIVQRVALGSARDEIAKLLFLDWQDLYQKEKPYQIIMSEQPGQVEFRDTNLVFKESPDILISDLRGREDDFSLDQHGFAIRKHASKTTSFTTIEEIETDYLPEVEQLLRREVTGVDRIRRNERASQIGKEININDRMNHLLPARNAHVGKSFSTVHPCVSIDVLISCRPNCWHGGKPHPKTARRRGR